MVKATGKAKDDFEWLKNKLKEDPLISYFDVQKLAKESNRVIHPVTYGRAKFLLGLVSRVNMTPKKLKSTKKPNNKNNRKKGTKKVKRKMWSHKEDLLLREIFLDSKINNTIRRTRIFNKRSDGKKRTSRAIQERCRRLGLTESLKKNFESNNLINEGVSYTILIEGKVIWSGNENPRGKISVYRKANEIVGNL